MVLSPRDHSRSLRNPTKRVSRLAPLVLGPSRFLDFRVFSNPRTENSWAGSVEKERKRASQRREGRDIVPFQSENPLKQRATLEWRAISAITTKKNCARWHLVLSPLFIPHPPFAYSPFFLPRRQLLPEWWNPVVTWLPKNTSCIFSRDFRIASPSPVSPSFAADVCFSFSLTESLLSFSRFRWALSRTRVWFTSSRLLIEFDARSWYCLRAVANPTSVSVSRWYCWSNLYMYTSD